MMIEKYIRQLLFAHDCVVIPDFGGFIAKYAPATIHPVRHTFMPPSKEIAFNEMLRLNDGLLISHVAVGEKISREEATRLIKEFADYVRGQIFYAKKYTFEEIGTISLTPEQRMSFEPLNRVNYLNDGYGLPELSFKPIERRMPQPKVRAKDRPAVPLETEEETEAVGTRAVRRYRQLWYALGFSAVLGLSALTGYYFFNEGTNLSSFNPFSFLITMHSDEDSTVQRTEEEINRKRIESQMSTDSLPVALSLPEFSVPQQQPQIQHETHPAETAGITEVTPPVEEKKAAVKTEKKKADPARTEVAMVEKPATSVAKPDSTPKLLTAEKETVKTEKTASKPAEKGRYYVIVNGFSVEANAKKFQKQLIEGGFEAARVFPRGKNGLIKVSIAEYTTRDEADAKAEEFKKQYAGAWVLAE